jgi:hypothetical protein
MSTQDAVQIQKLKKAFYTSKTRYKKLFNMCIDYNVSVTDLCDLCVTYARLEVLYMYCNELDSQQARLQMYNLLKTKKDSEKFDSVVHAFTQLKEWLYLYEPVAIGEIYSRSNSFPSDHSYTILPFIEPECIHPEMLSATLDVLDTLYEVGVFYQQNLGLSIKSLTHGHVNTIVKIYEEDFLENKTVTDLSVMLELFPDSWTPTDIVYFFFKLEMPVPLVHFCTVREVHLDRNAANFTQAFRKILTYEYPETTRFSRINTSITMLNYFYECDEPSEQLNVDCSKRFLKILSSSVIKELIAVGVLQPKCSL